ncbi:hypothetical protein [Streptomyces sp. cg36]|uniref:hypothetical protein n=1 Tax=Streptomyces sp. cg36 TaxID=3238798 RepID=UPI0034E2EC7F
MSDPTAEGPSGEPVPMTPAAGETGYEAEGAADPVLAVFAWYSREIDREWKAAVPDQARLDALQSAQQACLADLNALGTAWSEEAERIAARYRVRFAELEGKETPFADGPDG